MPAALTSPFAIFGLLLAAAGLVLCLFYSWRPHRLIPWAAAVVFLLSLVCAHLNSDHHIARIQIERAALAEPEEDSFSYADLLKARGEDVAPVRFAEDTQDDLIDRAGLDEADLAYFDSIAEQPSIPAEPPAVTAAAEDEPLPDPILVDEATFALAHKMDGWNLRITKILLGLAGFMIGYDYLRRFNHYASASFPLPLPSSVPNSLTPHPAVNTRTDPPRRSLPEEAVWLARRGDSFLFLTENPETAAETARLLAQAPKWLRPKTLIHIPSECPGQITDDFIFESLWYNRASFIIEDPARVRAVVAALLQNLTTRAAGRARLRQTAHLVWDLAIPLPERLPHLGEATGFSFLK